MTGITPAWVKTFSSYPNYIFYGLSTGVVMGLALSKSQAAIPSIIEGQLSMQNFTMVKVFLSAAVTSLLSVQCLIDRKWISTPAQVPNSMAKTLVGSVMLGAGMYYAGACPGTVLAQLGLRLPSAVYTMIGGLAGALAYSVLSPVVENLFGEKPIIQKPTIAPKDSIDKVLGVSRRAGAIITAAAFVGVLGGLETFRAWQTDASVSLSLTSLKSIQLLSPVWSPYISGLIIGLLQIPSFILVDNGLGTSSGYVVLLSHIFGPSVCNKVSYLKSHVSNGPRSTWQLFLDIGIVLGAAISLSTSGLHSIATSGATFSPTTTMMGGFLLIFGARLANGCTSGHGLTGISKLSVVSLFAVMGMFGGGIGTALLLGK